MATCTDRAVSSPGSTATASSSKLAEILIRHTVGARDSFRSGRTGRLSGRNEPEDWATAQQKLALAHLGAGDLTRALAYIDTARSNGHFETPLQRVQIETAHAHVLLTDPATRSGGHAVLDRASDIATRYGLKHQLRSIKTGRTSEEST